MSWRAGRVPARRGRCQCRGSTSAQRRRAHLARFALRSCLATAEPTTAAVFTQDLFVSPIGTCAMDFGRSSTHTGSALPTDAPTVVAPIRFGLPPHRASPRWLLLEAARRPLWKEGSVLPRNDSCCMVLLSFSGMPSVVIYRAARGGRRRNHQRRALFLAWGRPRAPPWRRKRFVVASCTTAMVQEKRTSFPRRRQTGGIYKEREGSGFPPGKDRSRLHRICMDQWDRRDVSACHPRNTSGRSEDNRQVGRKQRSDIATAT